MMTKNVILLIVVLVLVALCFVVGITIYKGNIIYKENGAAALVGSFQKHTQCVNQKCIAVGGLGENQCSADSNCITHTQCNNSEQCVAVSGVGKNKCATNKDCSVSNPQKWCESNNSGKSCCA